MSALGRSDTHHNSPSVVLVPTAVGCCPFAAPARQPDLRDHNLIRLLAAFQLQGLKRSSYRV
jgi:hypothetical protein